MIFHIQPVANILSLSVHRERLVVADVVNKKRNQFLRKLVGTVIIGAV
jgi:hypothetical protein